MLSDLPPFVIYYDSDMLRLAISRWGAYFRVASTAAFLLIQLKSNGIILDVRLSGFLIFVNIKIEIPYVRPWLNGERAAGLPAGVGAAAMAALCGDCRLAFLQGLPIQLRHVGHSA